MSHIISYSGVMVIIFVTNKNGSNIVPEPFFNLNSVLGGYSGIYGMQYSFHPSPINMYDPHIKSLVFMHLLYLYLC